MTPAPAHHFRSPFKVAAGIARGGTLTRALFHLALHGERISGRVLDLGAKSPKAGYYHHLSADPGTEVTYSDLVGDPERGIVPVDVEKTFPFPDGSFDTILAFHLLEHVFDAHMVAAETHRVLRPGGRLLVATPFLYEYHADPDDFVRFTDSGLRRLLEGAGLRCLYLEALGEGPLTACATRVMYLATFGRLRHWAMAGAYLLTSPLDRLLALRPRIGGRTVPVRFALEFVGAFAKP